MTSIALSRLHFPVTTLGPGRRIGIWMQGCSIHCPGCISADTWATRRGMTTVAELLLQVKAWLAAADGITISGGEPFDQPFALLELLTGLRQHFLKDIFVYSGHSYESLQETLEGLPGLIDALMTDPFLAGGAQSFPLRGSDNQRLHLLTSLGKERFGPYDAQSSAEPAFDVMFDEDGTVWFAGVPSQQAFARITDKLAQLGHVVATTEDRSRRRAGGGA